MSKPTRWSLVCAVCVVAWLVLAFACAHGGSTGGDNQDANVEVPIDAPAMVKQDSSTMVDAKADGSVIMQDAFVPPQQDAPSGPFCMNNSQCTNAGECCIAINMVGFCAPGTVIAGICFPN